MSHGSPKHRKRDRKQREKRPRLLQPKPKVAAKVLTAGLIGALAQPLRTIAFAEAIKEHTEA
jgi:hypothetical protein